MYGFTRQNIPVLRAFCLTSFVLGINAYLANNSGTFYQSRHGECPDCVTYVGNPDEFRLTSLTLSDEFKCARQVGILEIRKATLLLLLNIISFFFLVSWYWRLLVVHMEQRWMYDLQWSIHLYRRPGFVRGCTKPHILISLHNYIAVMI